MNEPLQTGIKAIDAMTPIAAATIIGDLRTGKTAICIDAIINQKSTGVKCFYVAIVQKECERRPGCETLRRHGAMDYTDIARARCWPRCNTWLLTRAASDGRVLHNGQDALIVYDDL